MADSPYFDGTYFDPDYFDTGDTAGGRVAMRVLTRPEPDPALLDDELLVLD